MFPIQAPSAPAGAPPARRAKPQSVSGFGVPDGAPAGADSPGVGVAPTSLAGMLALQADQGEWDAASPAARDRRARRGGRDVLEALAAMQRALLGGGADAAALARLAALAGGLPDAADPGLRAIIGDIGLRARVELARYGFV